MRPPQGFEWLLILLIILLLFGAKRLPDMARGVGRSMRILKAETRGLTEDDERDSGAATSPPTLPDNAAAPGQQPRSADQPQSKPTSP